MIAWKRDLQVIFTSERFKRTVVFGNNDNINFNILVQGSKYISSLKDEFTVRISHLTYREIIDLINGQFYDIEIKAGYKSLGGGHTIFKGGVLYISQELGDAKTTTAVILCTSKLIAKYGQLRLNFTLQSGINLYAALKYVCEKAGINNSNISNEFKDKVINQAIVANKSVGSLLEQLADENNALITADSQDGIDVSFWNPAKLNRAKIRLSERDILLVGSYPRISSDGLTLSVLPTIKLTPGDVIVIDNSLIDLSVGSKEEVFKNNSYFLDTNGEYMIYSMSYSLQNRGSQFYINIIAKSRNLILKAIGEGGLSNV